MLNLAVLGDPIDHSLSPLVHGAILDSLMVSYTYQKIRVEKGGLPEFLRQAEKEGIDGVNLTMPHKVDILPFLDEIDEEAARYRSVNTVCWRDGKRVGYNTDGRGYLASLRGVGGDFAERCVVILGAGGVARTLALRAAFDGARKIKILNRTVATAESLAHEVKKHTTASVTVSSDQALLEACRDCDIFLQTTPLGMQGVSEDFASTEFLDALPKTALVSDLIYRPTKTTLLCEAEKRGLKTLNGLGMLVYQAIFADEIYLGQTLDADRIFAMVQQKIKDQL